MTASSAESRVRSGSPEHRSSEEAPILGASGITRAFDGKLANDRVDFAARGGEVHALLGENGAGKTTLVSILCGQYRADAGEVYLHGRPVRFRSPREGLRAGVGVVYQDFRLVQRFTVAENVILGTAQWPGSAAEERVGSVAREVGFQLDPGAQVSRLSVGEQQQVEILKLLYRGADVLIFDEPTAVLTPQQSEQLFGALRELAAQGMAIVFITHRLREVTEVAHRVTVLRGGAVVASRTADGLSHHELAELMVGERLLEPPRVDTAEPGEPILDLKGVGCVTNGGTTLDGVDLTIRRREIVGVAGVSGNGQRELAEIVSGIRRSDSGERKLSGNAVAFVPEDRLATGLVGTMSTVENLAFRRYDSPPLSRRLRLRRRRMTEFAERLIREYSIPTDAPSAPVAKLSGGGLQRVLLARELHEHPALIVASQPTRGLDVISANAVRDRVVRGRDSGAGVLLISEDLDELMALSDRIVVILGGRLVAEFGRGEATRAQLGLRMAGGGSDTP